MNHAGAAHVTIVAFDGIIADTVPLRAKALAEATAAARRTVLSIAEV